MRKIKSSFSHQNLLLEKSNKEWAKPFTTEEIQESDPKKVATYDDLVKDVAQILHRHRNMTLFYRGQSSDHKVKGRTSILPTIFRKKDGERLNLKDRFISLNNYADELKKGFKLNDVKFVGTILINKYPEIAWSLLQHYEVCPTPLIDLTHSLHVACSFAILNNNSSSGIVYIIGMPWQTDAIGYNSHVEVVNLRLLSVCPPQAHRPFFQEGYLAGPFPNYLLNSPKRVRQFDFGRRLIAKFEIPNDPKFWGKGFSMIPEDKLYQKDDPVGTICNEIKNLKDQ